MRFDGRKIVVTGGTGALGRAVVEAVVAEGGWCVVPVHGTKPGVPVPGPGKVEYVSGVDLTDDDHVRRFFAAVEGLWASVHTAGGFAMSPIADTGKADFLKMIEINTLTSFLCCREAVRALRKTANGGRIVNVAAKAAVSPVGGMVAYSASKAAVVSITESLAQEVAKEGIWVNAVLPSIMDTPANRATFPAGTDFAKWPKVHEVAATILFLISPENRLTRGALLPVDGRG